MSLLTKPELGPDTLTSRPYQVDGFNRVRREFGGGKRSTLVIWGTGLGKTILISKICRSCVEKGGRALVIVHRDTLAEQTLQKLNRVGIEAGLEMASSYARSLFEPDVVVASVQSLQKKRLESFAADYFKLMIFDEAHHCTAPTYRNIIRHFQKAKYLGVTATPDRADEDSLADIFESVAHEMGMIEGMVAPAPGPYLSRLDIFRLDLGIDLRGLRRTEEDFNLAELEERLLPLIEPLANKTREKIGDRPTLIFTPDVGSATGAATAFQNLGMRADWVSGDCRNKLERIERFKNGDTQILCNCNLISEGVDIEQVQAIGLWTPTKSRSRMAQQIGRGTRLAAGKLNCLILDMANLTDQHSLVRPEDLFDTMGTHPEVLAMMTASIDKASKSGQSLDLLEVVEKSQKEHTEREVIRIRARERQVHCREFRYDPVAVAETLGAVIRGPADAYCNPATRPQIQTLLGFGISRPETLSKRRASSLIDILMSRRKQDKARPKQVGFLIRLGVPPEIAREMSFGEASAELDRLVGKRAS